MYRPDRKHAPLATFPENGRNLLLPKQALRPSTRCWLGGTLSFKKGVACTALLKKKQTYHRSQAKQQQQCWVLAICTVACCSRIRRSRSQMYAQCQLGSLFWESNLYPSVPSSSVIYNTTLDLKDISCPQCFFSLLYFVLTVVRRHVFWVVFSKRSKAIGTPIPRRGRIDILCGTHDKRPANSRLLQCPLRLVSHHDSANILFSKPSCFCVQFSPYARVSSDFSCLRKIYHA